MKKINIKSILLCCVASLLLHSCNDMDPVPTNEYTDATFWQSVSNAEQIVNMAYNQMYSADKMWNDEALSDNVFEGRSNTAQRTIRNGTAEPSLGIFASEWKWAYEGIKTSHIFLEFVDLVPDMDESLREQRKAEIRFIRAFLYFRLVNFYGDVPFFTKDITLEESKTISRTPKAEILSFIHAELDEIMNILPNKSKLSADDNGRITKAAASALQARAYLYEGNWDKVITYCENIMNNSSEFGSYGLFEDYAGLFLAKNEYNKEVILDYGYVPSLKTWSKFYDMAPLSAGARLNALAPLQSLIDNYIMLDGSTYNPASVQSPYKDRDPRMAATVVYHGGTWTHFDGKDKVVYIQPKSTPEGETNVDEYVSASSNSTSTGYYCKKYYDMDATSTFGAGLNIIMFRYADILLMYAEAKFEKGEFNKTVWDQTIKPIRERAGFTASKALQYPTLSPDAMRKLIRNERRSELALEGLRYYDIVRWKAGKEYLDGYVYGAKFANNNTSHIRLDKRQFNDRDYLWAVPQSQIDLNPNLKPNNPGYAN
ncbi:RagB/SusD family nutrient uptake outer membrane protein [Dysgonomonas sp. Marseille-P4361]|uniref:RagB/SusD family nutrient uptake outer membrane protein n=1 Tax=Dysgonomonas sp. Marseille-P4361 TaxID=2161820 RepID=UPI000D558A06|nr:RagB/SusD family nutrient uptake outer membrane protein [Dysgonomonas sp. Marseille-P4361]